jgi:hypothetical protein
VALGPVAGQGYDAPAAWSAFARWRIRSPVVPVAAGFAAARHQSAVPEHRRACGGAIVVALTLLERRLRLRLQPGGRSNHDD